jgi:hypothetical protein
MLVAVARFEYLAASACVDVPLKAVSTADSAGSPVEAQASSSLDTGKSCLSDLFFSATRIDVLVILNQCR